MRRPSWHWARRAAAALVALLVLAVFVALAFGELRGGYLVSQRSGPVMTLGTWLVYATANSAAAAALHVAVSSVLGSVLAASSVRGHRGGLMRGAELFSALPAVVLACLWLAGPHGAPLLVITLVVAAQRSFQVAVVINQAVLQWWSVGPLPSDPDFGATRWRRWSSLLMVSAAHSTALLFSVEAAAVLLGFAPQNAPTWVATLCAAAQGDSMYSGWCVASAAFGTLALPAAFWVFGESATRRRLALAEQPPTSGDERTSSTGYRDSQPS